MVRLSTAERLYIVSGIGDNIRGDGRQCLDLRPLTLETGVLPTASGSARVRVGQVTDVLVGIKCDIGDPLCTAPDEGVIDFSVECSGLASPEYERRGAQGLNAELVVMLRRLFGGNGEGCRQMRKGLCLIKGRRVWRLNVDCVVLDNGGGLFDALTVGVRAALRTCILPGVEVTRGEADEEDEVEVDDTVISTLSGADLCPVGVSLAVVVNDNVDVVVADATTEEESCAEVVVSVGVNSRGRVCGIVKSGKGGLDFDTLSKVVNEAKRIGLMVIEHTDALLDEDLAAIIDAKARPPVGFFT